MENYFHCNTIFICALVELTLTFQHLPPTAGVVYYVKPTEPCAHNSTSSCPSNETCHTMDHYASYSSHYFSPDHINVTLYFMCGVHNCTKHLKVCDLQTFAMIGTAGRELVIVNMPIATEIPNDPKNVGNRTYIFTNVSNVKIENAAISFISLNFVGESCLLEANHVDFRGYIGSMSPMVSVINITRSQAMLQDCTFQNNCFVRVLSYAVLTVSDCTFHSYNHAVYSAVALDNSTIKLSGAVTFANNTVGNDKYPQVCGAAISTNTGHGLNEIRSSVISITEAYVRFINNTAMYCGGAIYLKSAIMNVSTNVTMILIGNRVMNSYYFYGGGGAMHIENSHLSVNKAVMLFLKNSAHGAAYGGAIYQIGHSSIIIGGYSRVIFVSNIAQFQGGGVHYFHSGTLSVDEHSIMVFYNNSADQGGAVYMLPQTGSVITVGDESHIEFSFNTATKYGGAIYAAEQQCFFDFKSNSGRVIFKNNSAKGGIGMHIYGSSIKSCMNSFCSEDIVHFVPNITTSLSPVSSSPKRICLCDANGKPQCANLSRIFINLPKLYRGETFNISVVVVGYDFGVTTGTVVANFIPSRGHSMPTLSLHQYHQWIDSSQHCSNVSYAIYSNNTYEPLYLHTAEIATLYMDKRYLKDSIKHYNRIKHRCINSQLLTTPVFLNISLLNGCPPGFILTLQDQLYGCNCYPVLQINQFNCYIINNSAYLKWNSTMWVNATFTKSNNSESGGILLAHYCPLNYCKSGEKWINLGTNPNAQCDFNHAGVLCGGCRDGYSLAIGSSCCIRCSNNGHVLLFLFFMTAGFLLVMFILILNLTVTQGLINGLIFYANILWTYKDISFPQKQHTVLLAFQTFIAWLNLDFGIETCFVVGLTAFWKTWLQFLFPLYIWLIAGVIIIACHYSSHLTNLIGDRAVPLLATLFLLSYIKLLRTLMTIFEFGVLMHYPDESQVIVWYLDGNLPYCQHPHIYLFLVAMAILLFFCLPFTFFLLLIRCWRRISHLRLLRWINKFTPFYDAYFAPLEDKHHYWFGTLLLIRGALLIIFTATSSTRPLVCLFILAVTLVMLLFYMSIKPVYKSKIVRLFESASLSNLLLLICYMLYTGDTHSGTTALQTSIGVAFIQFLLIIFISAIKIFYLNKNKCRQRKGYDLINQDSSDDEMVHERFNDPDINANMYVLSN